MLCLIYMHSPSGAAHPWASCVYIRQSILACVITYTYIYIYIYTHTYSICSYKVAIIMCKRIVRTWSLIMIYIIQACICLYACDMAMIVISFMDLHTYIHTYIHTHMHVHMHTEVHTHTYIHICIIWNVHIAEIYLLLITCVYISMHAYIYVCKQNKYL